MEDLMVELQREILLSCVARPEFYCNQIALHSNRLSRRGVSVCSSQNLERSVPKKENYCT
jgi:hypothetical protein